MKGLELPINMIIIIAIAVLVLVVIAAYFSSSMSQNNEQTQLQSAWNNYCGQARYSPKCVEDYSSVQIKINGVERDLEYICNKIYHQSDCANRCCAIVAD